MTKDYLKRQFSNFARDILTPFFVKQKSLKNAEVLDFEWERYDFNAQGESTSTIRTNTIDIGKFYGKGLILITFPDEIKCKLNVPKFNTTNEREQYVINHPFSLIVNEDDFIRVGFYKKDRTDLLPTDPIASEIKIYAIKNIINDCDISVAPSDATENDKLKATIVLDGINDTRILASLFSCYNSIKVLLYGGTYNINEMWTGGNGAYKVALPFLYEIDLGKKYRRYISIHGEGLSTPQTINATIFRVSQSLHESMTDDNVNYFLIGTPYAKDEKIMNLYTCCDLKYFNIIGWKYDKPITYIDTSRCVSAMIECVNIRSWAEGINTYNPFADTPNLECTGIRVGLGSNYGIHDKLSHLNVWYCGKGVVCNGEHFIFEDVKVHHDYIGFVFGDKLTYGKQEHPNVMIGCSIEGCYRMGILSKNGETTEKEWAQGVASRSTLVMIGTSTELVWSIPTNEIENNVTTQTTKPFKEIIKGAWRGRIEIDAAPSRVWESGSGANFTTTAYN